MTEQTYQCPAGKGCQTVGQCDGSCKGIPEPDTHRPEDEDEK